ncbi:hypothetical protein GCM10010399_33310 [Dactylosporangium fulvum]
MLLGAGSHTIRRGCSTPVNMAGRRRGYYVTVLADYGAAVFGALLAQHRRQRHVRRDVSVDRDPDIVALRGADGEPAAVPDKGCRALTS